MPLEHDYQRMGRVVMPSVAVWTAGGFGLRRTRKPKQRFELFALSLQARHLLEHCVEVGSAQERISGGAITGPQMNDELLATQLKEGDLTLQLEHDTTSVGVIAHHNVTDLEMFR
jgi:hypothetical protein